MTQQSYNLNSDKPVFMVTADGNFIMDGDEPKAFAGVAYPDPSNTYLLDEAGNYLLCDGEYLRVADGTPVNEEPSIEESAGEETSAGEAALEETEAEESITDETESDEVESDEIEVSEAAEEAPTETATEEAVTDEASTGETAVEETLAEESVADTTAEQAPQAPVVSTPPDASSSPAIPISAPHLSYATAATPPTPANVAPPAMASSAPLVNPSITYITGSSTKKSGISLPLAIVIMLLATAAGVGLGWLIFNVIAS